MIRARFAFPADFGPRRAGLGNELFPLAKAFLAAEALDARLLPIAWGLNARSTRGYSDYFRTSRLDWVRLAALSAALPTFTLTEDDYRSIGRLDYGECVAIKAQQLGMTSRRAFAFKADGLWGEFAAILGARSYINGYLLSSRSVQQQIHDLDRRVPENQIVVAVHIRLGDFLTPPNGPTVRGVWNTRLPLEWYRDVCRSIRAAFGSRVSFYLATDGDAHELEGFIREFAPITHFDLPRMDVANLVFMSRADLLVCSVSSYSQWAAFLGEMPYVWYKPHLRRVDSRLTIWGTLNGLDGDGTVGRGVPVGDDGAVPGRVFEYVGERHRMLLPGNDLVQGGGAAD